MSAALSAVYNNYLTAYATKPLTRYDTHKKSELRSVYNSIVKINRDAPWYLPTTSKDAQRFAVNLKENARELRNTIAQLGGLEEEGLFGKKGAYSSDEDVATASYIGPQKPEENASLSLEVRSLASSQENLGLFLPDEKAGLEPDTYSFDIGINDMNYEFQFSVGEGETNRAIQERLARLLNNSGIGVRAGIAESEGRTALRLTSESTGRPQNKGQQFSVSDDRTSKRAGTVAYFGLDYVARPAENARVLVNGEERTFPSNQFTLDKMFEIELKAPSAEDHPVSIGLKTDTESLADNVRSLVGGYNDFLKAASTYQGAQSRGRQLVHELRGIALTHGDSLTSLGLTMSQDGTLEVDREAFHQAASQSGDIAETFGAFKKFSDMLLRKTSEVSLNPMNYVEKTVVAYKNPGHNFISPYSTSAYSGMMFNGYC